MRDPKSNEHTVVQFISETGVIDEIDQAILHELIDNSRQSTQAIANACNISRPTAHERIKKLQEKEIIEEFSINLNYANCGIPLKVFILVSFDAVLGKDITQKEVAKLLSKIPFVLRVSIISGAFDFLVEVQIDYMERLADVITEQFRDIPGVGNTQTLISFSQYKQGISTTKRKLNL